MAKSKKLKIAPIHEILPQEIFVMILKKLGYKTIVNSRSTCHHWKNVIDDFKIVKIILSESNLPI